MNKPIRRSNLLVPITAASFSPLISYSLYGGDGATNASHEDKPMDPWLHLPDAVTLDLADGVLDGRKVEAREKVKEAIGPAGRTTAEVFVRVGGHSLRADLEASIWPGLTGIMLSTVKDAGDVMQASEIMAEIEQARGINTGSLEIIALLESALAVWNIRDIITTTPRVTQVGLGETDLCSAWKSCRDRTTIPWYTCGDAS